ncbi:hypothetical protein [Nocardia nepalensis]|uniref:hypothetical protein n=1 Tax=Nocardia nepalensis TaxID=3375448 RepID=UPI003B68257A
MRHRTELTRTYPCRACGGQLVFDPAGQDLLCPHCGNRSPITVPDQPVSARELHSAMAELRAQVTTVAGPQLSGEREVVCQNCGGHTTFTGTLTATRCPYCATPIQRDDVHNAPARLPVDGVIPFAVGEKQARELVEKWINGRWFAPSEFKRYRQLGSFASVYTAYFTYDADTRTHYTGDRGEEYEVEVGSGDERRTETRVRWYPVSGAVHNEFADLPVLANDGFDRDRIKALEPWPIPEAKAFTPEYVAGHLCRTYDHDAEQSFPEAEQRMRDVIEHTARDDIGGDRQRIHNLDVVWNRLAYKHLLLPIWLLTVIYTGRPFQVYVNGITGEVHGDRPWSKAKIVAAVLLALAVVAAIVMLYMRFHGHHGTGGHRR